jgi:hypothetical protein
MMLSHFLLKLVGGLAACGILYQSSIAVNQPGQQLHQSRLLEKFPAKKSCNFVRRLYNFQYEV